MSLSCCECGHSRVDEDTFRIVRSNIAVANGCVLECMSEFKTKKKGTRAQILFETVLCMNIRFLPREFLQTPLCC